MMLERSLLLLAVSGAALVLALLPVAVGLTILLGTTVPLEFGVGAGLAIVGSVKLAAITAGIVAVIRTPRAAGARL
ncbi:MAG TPA: hypothetical protein VGA41_10040 [Candidatus Dormibacteraeota bacterium]